MFSDIIKKQSKGRPSIKPKAPGNPFWVFEDLLDELIKFNQNNRKNKDLFDNESYLREYCTVRLDIGRQIGKSSYIKNHIKDNDALIVLSYDLYENYTGHKGSGFILDKLMNGEYTGTHTIIWFDNFSCCHYHGQKVKDVENKIYKDFANPKIEQTFIFLG